jgi:hypothetical protein
LGLAIATDLKTALASAPINRLNELLFMSLHNEFMFPVSDRFLFLPKFGAHFYQAIVSTRLADEEIGNLINVYHLHFKESSFDKIAHSCVGQ